MITGIAHTCYTVSDLERSIAFYRDGLGLEPAFDFTNAEGRRFGLYLHAGGRNFIELFEGQLGERAEGQSFRHVCLEVDDIEATVTALRERGVEVSDPKLGNDQSWQAWIADPDGNRFELHQYTPESWQTPSLA
ncbi:MAG TPA: VOC family protein [Anaerolineae bacterium]|nr:VOC family protein [Anaerolineae bacterium]